MNIKNKQIKAIKKKTKGKKEKDSGYTSVTCGNCCATTLWRRLFLLNKTMQFYESSYNFSVMTKALFKSDAILFSALVLLP